MGVTSNRRDIDRAATSSATIEDKPTGGVCRSKKLIFILLRCTMKFLHALMRLCSITTRESIIEGMWAVNPRHNSICFLGSISEVSLFRKLSKFENPDAIRQDILERA